MFSALWLFLLSFARLGPFLLSYVSNNANNFPRPLSAKEEAECLRLAKEGNLEAKNKLIEHNLRLVAHVAKKYTQTPGADADDIISIGTIGLMKGIDSFNPEKNARLATYVARCIENEILMSIRSSKKLSREVSINECLGHDTEGNDITFMDILTVEDDDVAQQADLHMDIKKLYQCIEDSLSDREKEIIMLRYGLNGRAITQREIAKKLAISRSYVSRIEKKALNKLAKGFKK